MLKIFKKNQQQGQTLIEAIVALALITTISIVVLGVLLEVGIINLTTEQRVEANLLGDQLIERARSNRSEFWAADKENQYHFAETDQGWRLQVGQQTVDNYQAWIEIEEVERNEQGDVVVSGIVDPSTILVKSFAQWTNRLTRTVQHQQYLTRHVENEAWIQTDWSNGPGQENWQDNAQYDADDGNIDATSDPGAVRLAKQGRGGWQNGPKRTSALDVGSKVNDIIIKQNFAYLAGEDENKGLILVDITDKEAPAVDQVIDIGGKASYLHRTEDTLYIATAINDQGFKIYDITDDNPQHISSVDINGQAKGVYVKDDIAYLAVENAGQALAIVNVANPQNPQLIGQLDIGTKANGVFVINDYAYLARDHASEGLTVVDVSDPQNPSLTTHLTTDAKTNRIWGDSQAQQIYLASDLENQGLKIIDVSDPQNPSIAHQVYIDGKGQDVYEVDDYIYLATDNNNFGLQIIENAEKDNPERIGEESVLQSARTVIAKGDYAYLGTEDPGKSFVIVDVLSKMNVTTVASIDVWDRVNGLAARDDYVYTATAHSLSSFMTANVEDPFNPHVSGFSFIGKPSYETEVLGDYAYICVDKLKNGLRIANIQHPLMAFLVGISDMDVSANDVAPIDDWAFVAASKDTGGLQTIETTLKFWPRVKAQLDIGGKGMGIAIDDTHAYIASDNPNQGFVVANISNPYSPFKVTGLDVGEAAHDIEIQGNTAFLATNSGVRIVDITDPANPSLISFYASTHAVNRLAVSENFVFLACEDVEFGLIVLDVENLNQPELTNRVKVNGRGKDVEVGGNFAAVGIDDPSSGLQIIWNGGGDEAGDRFAESGELTSSTYDSGQQVVYNRVEWSEENPPSTSIRFQLAIKANQADPWQWFGPDGTGATFFATNGEIDIPLSRTAGRYVRYKAFLQGPRTRTPVLQEVRINYSR